MSMTPSTSPRCCLMVRPTRFLPERFQVIVAAEASGHHYGIRRWILPSRRGIPLGEVATGQTSWAAPLAVSIHGTPRMITYQGLALGYVALDQLHVRSGLHRG